MRTVLGKIADRPHTSLSPDLIAEVTIATATRIFVPYQSSSPNGVYRAISVHFYDIEKPNAANANLRLYFATINGTTNFLTNYAVSAHTASSALTVTGATNGAIFTVAPAASPFSLVSSSGIWPKGVVNVLIQNPTSTEYGVLSWDSGYLNSASAMVSSYGHGGISFATGIAEAVVLEIGVGFNFSGKAIAYGWRS